MTSKNESRYGRFWREGEVYDIISAKMNAARSIVELETLWAMVVSLDVTVKGFAKSLVAVKDFHKQRLFSEINARETEAAKLAQARAALIVCTCHSGPGPMGKPGERGEDPPDDRDWDAYTGEGEFEDEIDTGVNGTILDDEG